MGTESRHGAHRDSGHDAVRESDKDAVRVSSNNAMRDLSNDASRGLLNDAACVFAYGSNLCMARMLARVPSARVVGVATLAGHDLRWHKAGRDGSGKCDAFFTGNDDDVVHGDVYAMTESGKRALDRFEGLGEHYAQKAVRVRLAERDAGSNRDAGPARWADAAVYVALAHRIDAGAKPWSWYKAHVVTGARQHGLPPAWIAKLEAVQAREDPDRERHDRETAQREG